MTPATACRSPLGSRICLSARWRPLPRAGSADARTILNWAANWQVERWGHGMAAAAAYIYYTGSNATAYYQTWAAVEGGEWHQ